MLASSVKNNGTQTGAERMLCFAQWRERLIAAERSTGWLVECDDAGRFLAVCRELVDALAQTLRQLAADGPVLEVCAGSGELARRLSAAGVRLRATDVAGSASSHVLRISAQAALRHYRPTVVLGVFVPFDAGVDEAVLSCPSVNHYVILNARIGGVLGGPALWNARDFSYERLAIVRASMLTRHDVWLGPANGSSGDILQHGEAWHLTRVGPRPDCLQNA